MTIPLRTKIIGGLAALCVLAAAAGILRFVKPLVPSSGFEVIYAEGEHFRGDGRISTRLFRKDPHYLYVPEVDSVSQWWVIDFENMMAYEARPPRKFLSIVYVLRNDLWGVPLQNPAKKNEWQWQFTAEGVSFAGGKFIGIIRRKK